MPHSVERITPPEGGVFTLWRLGGSIYPLKSTVLSLCFVKSDYKSDYPPGAVSFVEGRAQERKALRRYLRLTQVGAVDNESHSATTEKTVFVCKFIEIESGYVISDFTSELAAASN